MSLSVQRSVVESFKCNGKHVRSIYVKDEGQCLVSKDVYEAIGHEMEDEAKAIQRLVPENYKVRLGDAQIDLEEGEDNSVYTQPNTMLLKEPDLYCFLLRCKKPKAKPFTEWVVETVLPREVQKLVSAIEEKDYQIQALEFTDEKHQQNILRLNKEIDDLIANRHVACRGCLATCCVLSKKIAEKFTHITLFDVSTCSLKNIRDGLSFVTQTWRWLTNAMIQMLFIGGTGSSEK